MSNLWFALEGAWRVLLAGLIFGAGLPTIFAFGIRALAMTTDGPSGTTKPHPIGRLLGIICFATVVAAIAFGITMIVASGFGKEVVFNGILPTLQDK